MTPIKHGLYEFDKDSLIKIRKSMGNSQSKMAELLGVSANTLSRWETGTTIPDADSLAAIYSFAKEQGMSPASFFSMRSSPLEVKMGSRASNQSASFFTAHYLFQSYLNTQIELTGTEPELVIKVKIQNTASASPNLPKIVFMGVGLSIAHDAGDTQALRPSKRKIKINPKTRLKTEAITTTPWENDAKIKRLLETAYHRISGSDFPDRTSNEGQHGEVLFPGQSVIYEIDVTSEVLPYLQFRVEGTVSRRHLFHCEETFIMPENVTKPLALSAFVDFNTLDIHGALETVISSMPKFDSNTLLTEIQTFSRSLSAEVTGIKNTQEELNNVFSRHKFSWFRAHLRAVFIYLDRVSAAFVRMKQAIGSDAPDNISAESSAITALLVEAALLDLETQELMDKYNISEEDVVGS